MPRAYSTKVFDEYVDGTTPIDSGPQLNELFGRADKIAFQFYVTNSSSGSTPTLTATYWHSTDGTSWVTHTTLLSAVDISSTPYEVFKDTGSAILGAFGKVQITLGGTTPAAYIRVMATGRTD